MDRLSIKRFCIWVVHKNKVPDHQTDPAPTPIYIHTIGDSYLSKQVSKFPTNVN